jgi:hypothetical protein
MSLTIATQSVVDQEYYIGERVKELLYWFDVAKDECIFIYHGALVRNCFQEGDRATNIGFIQYRDEDAFEKVNRKYRMLSCSVLGIDYMYKELRLDRDDNDFLYWDYEHFPLDLLELEELRNRVDYIESLQYVQQILRSSLHEPLEKMLSMVSSRYDVTMSPNVACMCSRKWKLLFKSKETDSTFVYTSSGYSE